MSQTKISHLHLEKSIFNTTTYSQVCFQELYTSAADCLGWFSTEIASLSLRSIGLCCRVMIPYILNLALYF